MILSSWDGVSRPRVSSAAIKFMWVASSPMVMESRACFWALGAQPQANNKANVREREIDERIIGHLLKKVMRKI